MYNIERASPTIIINYCYMDVHQDLKHGTIPSHFSTWQKRALRIKALSYRLVHGVLFRKLHNGVLLRCLEAHDSEKVLCDLHDGTIEGHFVGNTTTHKVMQANFYWTTFFKDTHAYACKFLVCQRCAHRKRSQPSHCNPL